MKNNWKACDFVADAIGERSFQMASDWLNEKLPSEYQITRQTVWNWVVKETEPEDAYLFGYVWFYPATDERHKMAFEIMSRRNPEKLDVWLKIRSSLSDKEAQVLYG